MKSNYEMMSRIFPTLNTFGLHEGIFNTRKKFSFESMTKSFRIKIALSLIGIFGFPILVRGEFSSSFPNYLQDVINCWDGMLHVNNFLVLVVTLAVAISCAHLLELDEEKFPKRRKAECTLCTIGRVSITPTMMTLFLIFSFASLLPSIGSLFQVIAPSYLWNPFLWGTYEVYFPNELLKATEGMCLDSHTANIDPLCLSNESWDILSTGSLASRNADDVEFVKKGLDYVRNKSGGLIINVMSRDTVDAISPLRENVEALHRFIPNLSVVVFENDSNDGSRNAFEKWSEEMKESRTRYKVDLIQCEETENGDCVFGQSHRYDSFEAKNFLKSSAIGKMATFRQRIVDYTVESPKYKDYTHMMVIDLDLAISLSPLGILHSLGKSTDHVIASSGRQPWPGSLGTLVPPYDFSAFRPIENKYNRRLIKIHRAFCGMMPPGHRWRNVCDAMSSSHLIQVLEADRYGKANNGNELYEVASAFNGATIYPMKRIREMNPKYDSGDDGQRCEHIGFNLGFKESMFMNPKWMMNVHPAKPGGPSGWRAMKNILKFLFDSPISMILTIQVIIPAAIYIFSVMFLGMEVFYPLFVRTMKVVVVETTGTSSSHHLLPLTLIERSKWQMKQT